MYNLLIKFPFANVLIETGNNYLICDQVKNKIPFMGKNRKVISCYFCGSTVYCPPAAKSAICHGGCGTLKVVPKNNLLNQLYINDTNNFYNRLHNKLFTTFIEVNAKELELEERSRVSAIIESKPALLSPIDPPVMLPTDLLNTLSESHMSDTQSENPSDIYNLCSSIVQEITDRVVTIIETDREHLAENIESMQIDNDCQPSKKQPDMTIEQKQTVFKELLSEVRIGDGPAPKRTGDHYNDQEREKTFKDTAKDGYEDLIRVLKGDQGKLHEAIRIKQIAYDKQCQWNSLLEKAFIDLKDGKESKVDQYIFNQSDHWKIAQMSQNIANLNNITLKNNSILQKLIDHMVGEKVCDVTAPQTARSEGSLPTSKVTEDKVHNEQLPNFTNNL